MNRIEILNAFNAAIADLRVARALLNDRVRGTNDTLYDTVKDIDRTLNEAEKAYKACREKLPD